MQDTTPLPSRQAIPVFLICILYVYPAWLNDPEQLETPPAKIFYDEGHEYHLPAPQKRMGNTRTEAMQA